MSRLVSIVIAENNSSHIGLRVLVFIFQGLSYKSLNLND